MVGGRKRATTTCPPPCPSPRDTTTASDEEDGQQHAPTKKVKVSSNTAPTRPPTVTMFDVHAPPGLLGLSLTQHIPDQHVLSIFKIHATCVMKAQLQVGDELIGIDGNAILPTLIPDRHAAPSRTLLQEVVQLLHTKRSHPIRTLTFQRGGVPGVSVIRGTTTATATTTRTTATARTTMVPSNRSRLVSSGPSRTTAEDRNKKDEDGKDDTVKVIAEEDEEDDTVEVIEDPGILTTFSSSSEPPAAGPQPDQDDEEVIFAGVQNETRLPHLRHDPAIVMTP